MYTKTNYFVKEHNTYSRPQDINVKRKSQSQQPIQNQFTSKLKSYTEMYNESYHLTFTKYNDNV